MENYTKGNTYRCNVEIPPISEDLLTKTIEDLFETDPDNIINFLKKTRLPINHMVPYTASAKIYHILS